MSTLHLVRSHMAPVMAGVVTFALAAAPVAASEPPNLSAARDYCVSVSGQVQQRQAMWNTNADVSAWVDLGRSLEVCRFEAEDEASSRIYVDLLTLWSEMPGLAAAAYLSRVPMSDELPPGNPATYHCAELSGSSQFGFGAAGGGWVDADDPDDPVVALCVFPDGSAIDDWGIAYASAGTVRGADLSGLFRTDTSQLSPIFG